jgi:predicted transcriptional regulator
MREPTNCRFCAIIYITDWGDIPKESGLDMGRSMYERSAQGQVSQVPMSSRDFENLEGNEEGAGNPPLDERKLTEMTAQIVAAYLSRNTIPIAEVPQVIRAVGMGLVALGPETQPGQSQKQVPAVPVKSSVGRDAITCLICGRRQKMLKRHIMIAHGLSPAEYRQLFQLRSDYPMTAPNYAKKRSQLARQFGLGTHQKRE